MATTIKLKNSVTTTNAPSSLVQGEVAINITDKKVWVGNAATTPIQLLGAGASGTFGALTCTSLTNSGLTSGRVTYASTGGLLADSANFTFNGTTVTMANDASISGLTVGKGGGTQANNTALGVSSLATNTTGDRNTAVGRASLYTNNGNYNSAFGTDAMYANTTGSQNVSIGDASLRLNTTGSSNAALGYQALYSNTTASNNTAVGYQALYSNTTGSPNNAFGRLSLYSNTTGFSNSAFADTALYLNTTGNYNAGFGQSSLYSNTTGSNNTAIGIQALQANTTASNNTAVGYQAGYSNQTGTQNVFVGRLAGYTGTGSYNTYIGDQAGQLGTTATQSTFVGQAAGYATTTGNYNTALGASALQSNTTASNNTAVGYQAGYSNTTGIQNLALGYQAGYSNTTSNSGTFLGYAAGYSTTGTTNCFVGYGAGYQVTSGTKNTILGAYQGNGDGLDIRTSNNYAVISDGDGNRLLSTYNGGTLALDGGAVPQSGTGITFPATQSASSDANTLDDYEEGSWTPTVKFGATSATVDTVSGIYTKIGRFVYATGIFRVTDKNGGTGSISVESLPFSGAGISYAYGNFQSDNLSLPAGAGSMMPFLSGTEFRVLYQTTTSHADLQGTQVIPNSTCYFFVVYSV